MGLSNHFFGALHALYGSGFGHRAQPGNQTGDPLRPVIHRMGHEYCEVLWKGVFVMGGSITRGWKVGSNALPLVLQGEVLSATGYPSYLHDTALHKDSILSQCNTKQKYGTKHKKTGESVRTVTFCAWHWMPSSCMCPKGPRHCISGSLCFVPMQSHGWPWLDVARRVALPLQLSTQGHWI